MYLPLAGFSLGAGVVWMAARRRWGRTVIVPLSLGLLLAAAATASVSRNAVWKDEETLWADTILKSPGSAIAHEFLGYGYFLNGKLEEAIAESRTALELDPRRKTARINLGATLLALGRYQQAAAEYRTALEQGSTMLEARVGLGLALVNLGSYAEARHHLESAIAMNPGYATVHDALGVACANLGDFRAAEAAFAEAVALDPGTQGYRDHLETARRDRTRTQGPTAE
jgi:tetratricopeptide (TPR) repeat protein